jgi:hypothetical protein
MIIWQGQEGEELCSCVASGFTIAEVDEKFARAYPECVVCAIELIGDYVDCIVEI